MAENEVVITTSKLISLHVKDKSRFFIAYEIFLTGKYVVFHRYLNDKRDYFACLANSRALRTFALIVCAQPFCAGNATVICHASLGLTAPEDKHGVEIAGEKIFRPSLLLWIIGEPYFFNHESLTLLTIYKI